jgi:serine/threonine-protein kinase TTK/MPS1
VKDSPGKKKNVLSSRNGNTPLRPAPPPPKMSMLEAVTASAGASATASSQSSRRQRSVVHVNGKPYRRLDTIGKGGSCKVYKVMAENFKMLAMKKVNFSSQDGEAAIRGYKGEIDLLRKLSGVDRVIRLYDWEINDEKQSLTMVCTPDHTLLQIFKKLISSS